MVETWEGPTKSNIQFRMEVQVQRPLNKGQAPQQQSPLPPGEGPTDRGRPGHRATPCWHFSFSVTSGHTCCHVGLREITEH